MNTRGDHSYVICCSSATYTVYFNFAHIFRNSSHQSVIGWVSNTRIHLKHHTIHIDHKVLSTTAISPYYYYYHCASMASTHAWIHAQGAINCLISKGILNDYNILKQWHSFENNIKSNKRNSSSMPIMSCIHTHIYIRTSKDYIVRWTDSLALYCTF